MCVCVYMFVIIYKDFPIFSLFSVCFFFYEIVWGFLITLFIILLSYHFLTMHLLLIMHGVFTAA